METNDGLNDIVIALIIVLGACALIGITTIIVCVVRRKTDAKKKGDRTGNNSSNPEPVDHDRRNDRKAKKQNMCV